MVVNTLLPGPVHHPHNYESFKYSRGDVMWIPAKKKKSWALLLMCPPQCINFKRSLQYEALGPHRFCTNQITALRVEDLRQNAKLVKALTRELKTASWCGNPAKLIRNVTFVLSDVNRHSISYFCQAATLPNLVCPVSIYWFCIL